MDLPACHRLASRIRCPRRSGDVPGPREAALAAWLKELWMNRPVPGGRCCGCPEPRKAGSRRSYKPGSAISTASQTAHGQCSIGTAMTSTVWCGWCATPNVVVVGRPLFAGPRRSRRAGPRTVRFSCVLAAAPSRTGYSSAAQFGTASGTKRGTLIDVGQQFEDHPHAMPILDFGADHTWFVMLWVQATAAQRQELLREPGELRAPVDALVSVLAAAHKDGWLHRDIKPSNILHFDGRWTLAHWGIVPAARPDHQGGPHRPLHRHRGLRRPRTAVSTTHEPHGAEESPLGT